MNTEQTKRAGWLSVCRLLELEEDWDDQGSPPIDPGIIGMAARVVTEICEAWPELAAPATAPISGGTLQLEYRENELYLELEFSSRESVRWLFTREWGRKSAMVSGTCGSREFEALRGLAGWLAEEKP